MRFISHLFLLLTSNPPPRLPPFIFFLCRCPLFSDILYFIHFHIHTFHKLHTITSYISYTSPIFKPSSYTSYTAIKLSLPSPTSHTFQFPSPFPPTHTLFFALSPTLSTLRAILDRAISQSYVALVLKIN